MRVTLPRLGGLSALVAMAVVAVTFGGIAVFAWNASLQAEATGAAEAAASFRWIAALIVLTIVFLFGFIVLLIGHLIPIVTTPLVALQESITRIRRGAVRERFVPGGPDEIHKLGEVVNVLAASLGERDAKLRRTMKIDAIDSLISGVAHEVNTPLTVIWANEHLAFRHLAESANKGDPYAESALKLIQQNRQSILRLQMLSRALAEVAGRNRGRTGCDINLILTAIVALTHHARSPDLRFESRLAAKKRGGSPAEEIFHALYSLVLNMGTRLKGHERVEIWTEDLEDEVLVGIRGSAGGILSELVDLMHERGLEEGTPTSELRFAHAQIEAAGGSIRYEGQEGQAFQWRIRLPAAKDDVAVAEPAGAQALRLLQTSKGSQIEQP